MKHRTGLLRATVGRPFQSQGPPTITASPVPVPGKAATEDPSAWAPATGLM